MLTLTMFGLKADLDKFFEQKKNKLKRSSTKRLCLKRKEVSKRRVCRCDSTFTEIIFVDTVATKYLSSFYAISIQFIPQVVSIIGV